MHFGPCPDLHPSIALEVQLCSAPWHPNNSQIIRMYEMVLHELPARLTDLVVRAFGKEPFALRFDA